MYLKALTSIFKERMKVSAQLQVYTSIAHAVKVRVKATATILKLNDTYKADKKTEACVLLIYIYLLYLRLYSN